jgi:hypothetical protein
VVCVIGVLRRRTGWSVEWWISDLYDLCSRFLCRSPVLETQHVHDSRMVMVRWFFAGKFSAATSGATSCTDCEAGKFSFAGQGSACVDSQCPAGSFSSSPSACFKCDAGKFSAVVGASTCSGSVCAAGTHGPAGSTSSAAAACTSCPAGKYSATAGVESVCVVCVCVFSKKKKRDTYTLYHTQFIHNTYKWRKHKSVSTNNRLVSYTHSLSLYR